MLVIMRILIIAILSWCLCHSFWGLTIMLSQLRICLIYSMSHKVLLKLLEKLCVLSKNQWKYREISSKLTQLATETKVWHLGTQRIKKRIFKMSSRLLEELCQIWLSLQRKTKPFHFLPFIPFPTSSSSIAMVY